MNVTLSVDLREADDRFLPRGDLQRLVNLWQDFEQNLYGHSLFAGQQLTLEPLAADGTSLGRISVTVAHPSRSSVTPETQFQIVSVIEHPRVLPAYQCRSCRLDHRITYGPFTCRYCAKDDARVCDDHVRLLPGSLEGVCPEHTPRCECGALATAYCVGPHCRSGRAWCDAHARRRGENAYCAHCYDTKFPSCVELGCRAVGSLACQHLDATGRPCGRTVCPRHATTWQVFGPERPGLARCTTHAAVMSQTPAEMVYQILGNATPKDRGSVPRIAGFRYILAKPGRINPTEAEALRIVLDAARAAPGLRSVIQNLVDANRSRWEKEVSEGAESVAAAVARLTAWMQVNGSAAAVPGLCGVKWLPARGDKPDTLLIRVDRRYFNFAARQRAEASLGFSIQPLKEEGR